MAMETACGIVSDQLPIGFRFMPTDEELIRCYLTNKVFFRPLPAKVIKDIDADELYSKAPKDIVDNAYGEREWYFFIHNDDYFHGKRENVRVVGDGIGSWKSFGNEDPIYDNNGHIFAFKIHLTYYSRSISENSSIPSKTHWRMEEYRLLNPRYCKGNQEIEEWVLGRITRGTEYDGNF